MELSYFSQPKHANVPPAFWLVLDPQMERTPQNARGSWLLGQSQGRIDVIGDVHGHFALLMRLLTEMGWSYEDGRVHHPDSARQLVMLGDLINGGEDSLACMRFGADLTAQNRGMCLMGNHDWQMLAWAVGVMPYPPHSGAMDETVRTWNLLPASEQDRLIDFMIKMPELVSVVHPRLGPVECVHGGPDADIVPRLDRWMRDAPGIAGHVHMFGMPSVDSELKVRNCDWRPFHDDTRWTFFGHQVLGEVTVLGKTVGVDIGNRKGLAGLRLDKEGDEHPFEMFCVLND